MDYFGRYFTNEVFDFSGLINDDFVQPVRILFNAKHYVSATKLLMVAIDSVAYVEYGEVAERPNAFMRWLNTYAELATLDITSRELWEHRNALLHMSGLRSREVERGTVRMLVGHVGQLPDGVVLKEQATGHYNIYALIQVFGKALGRWLETYGQQRDKIEAFVARYDRIAADSRMMVIAFDDPANKPA